LHVVVAVDEDGGRVGGGGAKVADRQRVARGGDDVGLAARGPDALDHERRGPLEVGRIAAAGRDRGDAQPVEDVVEQPLVHGAGE
jgi:hypothetical protein